MTLDMKFTIITSTYNAGELLRETASSLQQQSYRDFQWIVADGASSDNTIEIAKGLGCLVATFISEPDRGIYEAWNKALPHVKGDWVLFLGAGDKLLCSNTLESIANLLLNIPKSVSIAYGGVKEVDAHTAEVRRVEHFRWGGVDGPWSGVRPRLPHHQGVFHNSKLFEKGFIFDTRCKIAADGEIVLKELIEGNGADLGIAVSSSISGGVSTLKSTRLRMNLEMIYINWKVGIFFKRPIRQLTVLCANLIKHYFSK